jgi:hypothetical protein
MLPLLALALALHATAPTPAVAPAPTAASAAPATPSLRPAPSASADPLRGDWSKPSGKRVSMSASALPVNDALEKVADAAGWNLVLNTGRTGARTLTLKLRDVAVEDAMRAALTGSGLVATRTGNTVVVAEEAEATAAEPQVLAGFERPTGRRVTKSFDDEDVADALKQLASAAGLSIVLPTGDLDTTVTATFTDVPVEDALRAVLAQAGLAAERQGELLVVRRGGLLHGLLPPGLSRSAERTAEEAMRTAERAMRNAQGEMADAQRRAGGKAGSRRRGDDGGGRDRQVTGTDLVVLPGEEVRDASVVKGNLSLRSGSQARDASAVLGSVTLDTGAEARDVVAVLGSTTLAAGSRARSVVSILGNVTVGPGAEVTDDAISIGGRVMVDPAGHVAGSTNSVSFPSLPDLPGRFAIHLIPDVLSPVGMVMATLVRFAVLFVLGLIVLSVMPRRLETVSGAMAGGPWRSLFAGLLGSVGMVVLAVLLAVTVVGLLLIPVQALLVVGGGVLGITALTAYLGRALPFPPSRRTAVLELAAGTLLFSILAEVPVIGAMAWVAAWFLTFGAVLRTRFGQPPTILPTTPAPPAA